VNAAASRSRRKGGGSAGAARLLGTTSLPKKLDAIPYSTCQVKTVAALSEASCGWVSVAIDVVADDLRNEETVSPPATAKGYEIKPAKLSSIPYKTKNKTNFEICRMNNLRF